MCQSCSRFNAEGNGHLQKLFVFFLDNVIVEIKSLLVAYGVPYGFLDFDRDSHSFEKNVNTLGKSKTLIRTSFCIALTLLPWATFDSVQGRASVFDEDL